MRTVIVCNCWVSHLQKNIGSMGVSENDWTPKWPFHLPRQLRNDPCENGHLIMSSTPPSATKIGVEHH